MNCSRLALPMCLRRVAGARGIQRKGIPGFEREDITRVLYDYKSGLNGWLTRMEAAKDFSEGGH